MNTLKNKNILPLFLSLSLVLIACGSDDSDPVDDEPQGTLEEQRDAQTQLISDNDSKTWKIESAILTNDSGTFDISENFNVKDDEFIFKADQSLEWRAGNDININGSNASETLLDYYRSPVTSTFDYEADSSTEATALSGTFSFTIVGANAIEGVLTFPGRSSAGEIAITLSEKTAGDYVTAPLTSGLNFSEVGTFQSIMVNAGSVGMIGSYADNSLMVITREDSENQGDGAPEKIFKFNLDNGNLTTNSFFQSDFVTKRPHIINGELVVMGARYVNIYDLVNLGDPVSTVHNANNDMGLTRFGSAVSDNDIYITGGDLDQGNNDTGEQIRKYNAETGQLEDLATLPATRYWAETEIVNNNLYIFGGRLGFSVDDFETESYIYNLDSGAISTFQLPVGCWATYAARQENLIYVGGQERVDLDGDGTYDDINIYLWVYNTLDDSITEIETDLDDTDGCSAIFGMTLFNEKLYVVYGDACQGNDPIPTWKVMAADLN